MIVSEETCYPMPIANLIVTLIPYIVAELTPAQRRLIMRLPAEINAAPPDRRTVLSLRALQKKEFNEDVAFKLVASTQQKSRDTGEVTLWGLTALGQQVRAWMLTENRTQDRWSIVAGAARRRRAPTELTPSGIL
jgi:hypothetical protein